MGKTGSPASKKVQLKTDPRQITFNANKSSNAIWRRMFLLRYFIKLGESELITVSWSDFDIKCKRITLDDEQKPFSSSLPSTLYKSVTQIFVKGKKLITITIFYTTLNCLVQGSVTQKWVELAK